MNGYKSTILRVLEKALLDGAESDPEFALTVVTQCQTFEGVKALEFRDEYIEEDVHSDPHYAIVKIITSDGDYHINPNLIASF